MSLCVNDPAAAARLTEAREVPWTYDGDQDGQEKWGLLSTAYVTCELGKEQSPVHIGFTELSVKPVIEVAYKPSKVTISHDKHMTIATVHDSMTLTADGMDYRLKSIMLHSPGEHTIAERFYPLEIQLLHESADGKQLMLAVFGEVGDTPHPELETLLQSAPMRGGHPADISLDPSKLLPSKLSYYAYRGSLPYPPCTEKVEWRILKDPIILSKPQLARIGELIGRNARLTQPLYLRKIEEKN